MTTEILLVLIGLAMSLIGTIIAWSQNKPHLERHNHFYREVKSALSLRRAKKKTICTRHHKI
jgi:hypothetical protein